MLTHRLNRLATYCRGLATNAPEALVSVIRDKRYPVLMREAALRWLIHRAPTAVTREAPFAARRRHVRRHYGV